MSRPCWSGRAPPPNSRTFPSVLRWARASAGTTADGPLPPGTLLLAYTDGLVERRGEDIDIGLAALAAMPITAAHALPDVLNAVLDRLAPAGSEDDVTLLAARTL